MQTDSNPKLVHAGDNDNPGATPPEVQPGEGGDQDIPGRHAPEQQPGQGATDQPGESPAEVRPQPAVPKETPPPD
ncbi:hypothetical protein GRI89_01175 [Altererythrobacter salegens]|uniref:Uncharacterized protein n=1 Tax=Croceibacterium salegens TaxID=1737568 RepID=A0A6I4ST23_9SPHN|nr:hypothetical protein [Croceibacterium salegens]MXO58157.1 hypothetical protein [Croceibacterium salegens]